MNTVTFECKFITFLQNKQKNGKKIRVFAKNLTLLHMCYYIGGTS